MVGCCVTNCKNKSEFTVGISYFSIPVVLKHQGTQMKEISTKRCEAWIAKINRKNWVRTKNSYVCQHHFISGESF